MTPIRLATATILGLLLLTPVQAAAQVFGTFSVARKENPLWHGGRCLTMGVLSPSDRANVSYRPTRCASD